MTRRVTRPTAASRTACVFCGDLCGGTCTATAPRQQLLPPAIDTAISLARDWATKLASHHGLAPRAAAHVAARRFSLTPDDIYVAFNPKLARVWLHGALARPTRRPTRVSEDEDVEMERSMEKRGAA
jgi:hypothetical protein